MRNKTFSGLRQAYKHFFSLPEDTIAYLLHNREENTYEVVNQELYDHYQNEFCLDMELLDYVM